MKAKRLVVVVLTAALLLPSTPGTAATKMIWGITQRADVTLWAASCSAVGQVWAKEFGASGVTRFRARWELRSPYDTGWLPTYAKTSYVYSAPFPNDARNFYQYFTLREGRVNYPANKEFALWVKIVGERPSFWQRDIVRKGSLGRIGCNLNVGGG
jgi:hypothetical protein